MTVVVPERYGWYGSLPLGALVGRFFPASEALSGQMPGAMMPTTTPSPAFLVPPSDDQTPVLPDSFRKSVEFLSSLTVWNCSGVTERTPGIRVRSCTWVDDSLAAKALSAVE